MTEKQRKYVGIVCAVLEYNNKVIYKARIHKPKDFPK